MGYLYLFLGAVGATLLWFWVAPTPGIAGVHARLGALEVGLPGLVPVPSDHVREVRARRQQRAWRKRWGQRIRRWGLISVIALSVLALAYLVAWRWGWRTTLGITLVSAGLAIGVRWTFQQWRTERVTRQLLPALRLLAQNLATSNSFYGALEAAEQRSPKPIARELARVHAAIAAGATEEQALWVLARRNPSADVTLVMTVLSRTEDRGARLAGVLFALHDWIDRRNRARIGSDPVARLIHGMAWMLAMGAAALALVRLRYYGALPPLGLAALALCGAGTLLLDRLSAELEPHD